LSRAAKLGLAVLALGVLLASLLLRAGDPVERQAPSTKLEASAAERAPRLPEDPRPGGLPPGPIIFTGATLEVDAEMLAASPELPILLDLDFVSPKLEPLRGRVLAISTPEREALPIEAAIAGDEERHAALSIPSEWLTPGRYVVEVRTHERSHLPLRRYVLEVSGSEEPRAEQP